MSQCNEAKKICVCGAGHQGLSMAAHLSLNGIEVGLWNRTESNIREIIDTGIIHCTGIVNGDAKIVEASSNIVDVISDFVMITTPSTAHKDIARELAPLVNERMIIILNPGRTFGAIEFVEELKKNGVKEVPQIAETQTIVYTCRKNGPNNTSIIALKREVEIAAISGCNIKYIMERIPGCLKPYFKAVDSVAITSFSNIGMVLHCAPTLMNVGWIETSKVDFKYYYDGISPSIAAFIEKIDGERQKVAYSCGYNVESLKQWLKRTYAIKGDSLYECILNNEAYREIDAPSSINSRYIFEDVPNGLVPIEAIGRENGVQTPNITTIIDLACSVMNTDYRKKGRRFSAAQLREYL